MAGRRPKPTALKELAGNPGRRPLNEHEPAPPDADPLACPEDLPPPAAKEWARIAPLLADIGILTSIDTTALAAYCCSYARWIDAEKNIRKFGAVIKTPKGYPIQSPYLAIANTAMDAMRKFLVEFGMTPSSRSRVNATAPDRKPDATDPWGQFAA